MGCLLLDHLGWMKRVGSIRVRSFYVVILYEYYALLQVRLKMKIGGDDIYYGKFERDGLREIWEGGGVVHLGKRSGESE